MPLQTRAMRQYAVRRGRSIAVQVKEIGSGTSRVSSEGSYCRRHAVARSMGCWSGVWTAGDDLWRTWWR
ncbi:MAG: hypothetical protein DMG26_18190, partial [Acidobacteria bacterium]